MTARLDTPWRVARVAARRFYRYSSAGVPIYAFPRSARPRYSRGY